MFPSETAYPIIVIQHRLPDADDYMTKSLDTRSPLSVKEPDDKEPISGSTVYIAPPNYHLLIERNNTFSLSTDNPVCYSRPSIDVTFESAAWCYKNSLVGVLLTGANNDGSEGISTIQSNGGTTIVQNPTTAEYSAMPENALAKTKPNKILNIEQIVPYILSLQTTC